MVHALRPAQVIAVADDSFLDRPEWFLEIDALNDLLDQVAGLD
jgi:hypothetical protein